MDNNIIFTYNDKIKYFIILIQEAYNHNKNFKNINKKEVQNNCNNIISQMKIKFNGNNYSEILGIISTLKLWNRCDLPRNFTYDFVELNKLQKSRMKILEKINQENNNILNFDFSDCDNNRE